MKFVQLLGLLFFLSLSTNLFAQKNLIYNSDFEDYKSLPDNVGQGKKCLQGWIIPVLTGGGDYYHAEAKGNKANVYKNYFGKQEPHSGDAYTGICITNTYREYLQTEFTKPLEKGRKYKVELYISCGDVKWLGCMKGFCIIFTTKSIIIPNEPLKELPSVVFRNEDSYKNSKGWDKLEAIYEADGTEKFLTFGSFVYRERNESAVKTYNLEIPGAANYAHYYIDDFTLTPLEEKEEIGEIADPPAAETPKVYETNKTYIFKNIVFDFGKAELLPSSFDELNELAEYLISNPAIKARITGHTDNVGKKEDNLFLSKNRALAVLNYLSEKNIPASRLSFDGKGDSEPIVPNDTEEGKHKNRRVEVVFY